MTAEKEWIQAPTPLATEPMLPLRYRILARRQETDDVFTLELEPQDGIEIAPYLPGQFNMLYVYGVGEIPISVSGDRGGQRPLMHTTRAVGTVTHALSRLDMGDTVGVRGPFGTAWPMEEAKGRDVVFIAGGIGLAPLRPAICEIAAQPERDSRLVVLFGARTPDDLLFRNDLATWRDAYGAEVFVTVDNATPEWLGNVGFVTRLIRRAPFDPYASLVMICGPEIMMRYSIQELNKRGVSDDRIYVTMERNMKCAIGFCGHCQFGPEFVCKDGPVFRYDKIRHFFNIWEV